MLHQARLRGECQGAVIQAPGPVAGARCLQGGGAGRGGGASGHVERMLLLLLLLLLIGIVAVLERLHPLAGSRSRPASP